MSIIVLLLMLYVVFVMIAGSNQLERELDLKLKQANVRIDYLESKLEKTEGKYLELYFQQFETDLQDDWT